jgi:phosphoglycerol transferase MdoB-like AlkP superfamily enzyme
VTMENHGPWDGTRSYQEHLRNSDQLIGMMIDGLDQRSCDYVFAFFGDHRPSLTNITSKGTTPFVIIRRDPPDSRSKSLTISAAEMNGLLVSAITAKTSIN